MAYYAAQPAPPLEPHPLAFAAPGPTLRPTTWAPPPPIPEQHSQAYAPVEPMFFDTTPRPCTLSCCAPTAPPPILTAPVYKVSYSLAGALTPVDAPQPLQRAPAAPALLSSPLCSVPPLWSFSETRSPTPGTPLCIQDLPSSSSSYGARCSLAPSPVHMQEAPLEYFYEPETTIVSSLTPSPVRMQDAYSEYFYEPETSSCISLTPSPPPLHPVVSVKEELPDTSLSAFGAPSVSGRAKAKGRPRRDKPRTGGLIHTGEQPYVCDICGVEFIRKHDNERHRRSHTGERPFPCHGGCGKAFRRADARSRHWGVYRECEWRHTTFLEGTPEGARRTRRLRKRVKRAELVAQGVARPLIERILKKM